MPDRHRFEEMFRLAQTGRPGAGQAFFDEYAPAFLRAIRARMNPAIRVEWDSTDFMQQTRLKLALCKLEELVFPNPQALIAFVTRIAEREVDQANRKYTRRKHRQGRPKSLEALTQEELEQLVDRASRPAEVLEAEERWINAIKKLPLPYRYIAIQLRKGHKHKEIAEELKLSERTVRRVVEKLSDLLNDDKTNSR